MKPANDTAPANDTTSGDRVLGMTTRPPAYPAIPNTPPTRGPEEAGTSFHRCAALVRIGVLQLSWGTPLTNEDAELARRIAEESREARK